jgi:hypothetical protein
VWGSNIKTSFASERAGRVQAANLREVLEGVGWGACSLFFADGDGKEPSEKTIAHQRLTRIM